MAKNKKAKPAVEKTTPRSEIIEQCVIYAQSIAAHTAGFEVDHRGDSDHASKNRLMKKATRAMIRLIALSPAADAFAKPLSALGGRPGTDDRARKRRPSRRDRRRLHPAFCSRSERLSHGNTGGAAMKRRRRTARKRNRQRIAAHARRLKR